MSVMEIISPRDLLVQIEKHYKGTDKIKQEFFVDLMRSLERGLPRFSQNERSFLIEAISRLYPRVKRGIHARELHHELSSLIRQYDVAMPSHGSDSAIARLERQLRDLQTMVASPIDMEQRFRDLQNQVAAIREDMEDGHAALTEKQEDMLQRFLNSEKRAFIIMPFQRDFDNVWHGAIKPACIESHYAPLRVDEVNLSSLITDDIERYSGMANVVVVDLTGNSPNVMFELGWSLAKNKKPIVICQGEYASKVAFDVRGIRHISYENSWLGIEALKKKIKEYIALTDKQPAIKKQTKQKTSKQNGS